MRGEAGSAAAWPPRALPGARADAAAASAARDYAAHVSPSLLAVAATLLALAGVRDGETVVDVGCGAGLLTHPAAAAAGPAGRAYGVDVSPEMLALARERRPSEVCWVRGDATRLPFAAGSVDKVVCGGVLNHLADVRPALAEYARVLAPSGRLAVSAWGDFRDDRAENAVLDALAASGVDRAACERRTSLADGAEARDAAELPDLLRAAGLRIVHRTDGEVTVPFAGAAAYATWRLAFPRAAAALAARDDAAEVRAAVVDRVGELLGGDAVIVHSRIHYVTATPGG